MELGFSCRCLMLRMVHLLLAASLTSLVERERVMLLLLQARTRCGNLLVLVKQLLLMTVLL